MDRENVISGLQYTIEMFLFDPATGYTKDPDDLNAADRITLDACKGAIALLKEQEAVKPIKPLDKDDDYTFMCSNCKGELFCGDVIRDNFCPTCGRSVKWE